MPGLLVEGGSRSNTCGRGKHQKGTEGFHYGSIGVLHGSPMSSCSVLETCDASTVVRV